MTAPRSKWHVAGIPARFGDEAAFNKKKMGREHQICIVVCFLAVKLFRSKVYWFPPIS